MTSLLERLGRPADSRLLIINAHGLGACHATNQAIGQALGTGVATSATIQVPCPWFRGALGTAMSGDADIGVEFTLTAPWEAYRWSSLTGAPSLADGAGGLPSTPADLWDHADPAEVYRECRAQLTRATELGITPSHLTDSQDALVSRPEYFDTLLELAVEHRLPISLPGDHIDLGFPARKLAGAEGIPAPDYRIEAPPGRDSRETAAQLLADLPVGVTELRITPGTDTPELRAATPSWASMVSDAHMVTHDWGFRAQLQRSGAELIGFGALGAAVTCD